MSILVKKFFKGKFKAHSFETDLNEKLVCLSCGEASEGTLLEVIWFHQLGL